MSERLKRLLIMAGFVIIVLLIGFAIWWVFFRPTLFPVVPPPGPAIPQTAPRLPSAPAALPRAPVAEPIAPGAREAPAPIAAGGVTELRAITEAPALAPSLTPTGQTIQYYSRSDGKFYRVKPDGNAEALSEQVFFNVSKITWAPDRERAILEYPDGANILYDFEAKRQITLPAHWQSFSFSPRSDKIAFLSMGLDRDSRWLAVAETDGSQSTPIEPLGDNANKVQVAWSPGNQIIAFSATGLTAAVGEQEILPIGLQGENFHSLIVNGIGFRGRFSPNGEQILYSTSSFESGWKPQLWLVSGTPSNLGSGKAALGLNTWADKCAFGSATTIFCATPRELPQGAGLYPAAAASIPDELWQVNLVTGARQRLAIPDQDVTIESIVVTESEDALYFTDRVSGKLYKIKLK